MLEESEKMLSAGCSGFFEKPFDLLTIVAQIYKLIRI